MSKKRRPWPAKRRKAQAANARKNAPWRHATGPKTDAGKAASRQNALKSGLHTAETKALLRVLSLQAKILRDLGAPRV